MKGPTHKSGHTLDLILTRSSENLLEGVPMQDEYISDHASIIGRLDISKPTFQRREISFRKISSIDSDSICKDISASELCNRDADNVSLTLQKYDSTLTSILDKHAPVQTKVITVRPREKWLTEEILIEKRYRRKLEKQWRKTCQDADYHSFVKQRDLVNAMISDAIVAHFSEKVEQAKGDQKALFKTVKSLLNQNTENPLPSGYSDEDLANKFSDFFCEKVTKIRNDLDTCEIPTMVLDSKCAPSASLSEFSVLTVDEVKALIRKSPSKSCALDPIPTELLKQCMEVLAPILTDIINQSLANGDVPSTMKEALLFPLLKKITLALLFPNYRPVSNLSFVSKLTEKAVAKQVLHFMCENGLGDIYQSSYKRNHSTETALTRVQNDILRSGDDGSIILLILLDLSAAFDTVDHQILLQQLQDLGITGTVLKWFRSYLSDRSQQVIVKKAKSEPSKLQYGVPQGSVLGPILFTLYTIPLGRIIQSHGLSYHLYADDTQIYMSFKPAASHLNVEKIKLEKCIEDIKQWMTLNKLKLNDNKTEFVIFGRTNLPTGSIQIGEDNIPASHSARNLGVMLDSKMKMTNQVSSICKSVSYHLRNISKVRKYLTMEAAEALVHALVSSRLDYCNALLMGIPACQIKKLQLLQNKAARIVTKTAKYDHITPVLKSLHWLPVKFRIDYKVLLLVFKCLYGEAPEYLKELVTCYQPTRNLRSGTLDMLSVPRCQSKLGDRAFSVAGPKLWNSLPGYLRRPMTSESFKKKLKTVLFKRAYD